MCLCQTCKKKQSDWEVSVSHKPDDVPDEFRTWMICSVNADGFPWREQCDQYERKEDGNKP